MSNKHLVLPAWQMKKLSFGFFIILFLQVNVYAISLKEALTEALNNNPSIKAARNKYESAKAKVPQAVSLNDPWFIYKSHAEMDIEDSAFEISQEIPFPTKLLFRGRVADSEAKSKYAEYKEKERDILVKVKSSYAELYLAYRVLSINKENKALLEQLADSAANRYALGKTGQSDALRAQVELAKINNNLVIWEQKRQSAQAKLNILLNRGPEEDIGEPILERSINISQPIEELYSLAKENRPELKVWHYMIDKARYSLSLAKQEYLPDFMISYEKMFDSSEHMWMFGVSVPVWFWQKQNYELKEMEKELEMAEADFNNMENMVLFDIKDMHSQVEANQKLKELYETSFLPQAEQSLKASLAGYESGIVDFLSLLDSQRMLLEFKMEYYDALVNLEIAIAELEKAVGVDLVNEIASSGLLPSSQ